MQITRVNPGPRMSRAVVHGDTVYLCGHVAKDTNADTEGQTRDVLAQVEALLREAGSDKSKVLAATVYMLDIREFNAMNTAWDAWVDPTNPPARTTVEARLARPGIRVEITVTAAR
ncbi:MAG: RidA family protein [Candidatus Lambdaproteobacteria bacterium]|nr:RidA family protein [Candidatus Lambdaproteobacteria bacterium]